MYNVKRVPWGKCQYDFIEYLAGVRWPCCAILRLLSQEGGVNDDDDGQSGGL